MGKSQLQQMVSTALTKMMKALYRAYYPQISRTKETQAESSKTRGKALVGLEQSRME